MEEISRKLVFPLFELLLGDANWLKDGDVQSVLLALEQVGVEEVDNLTTILPGPGSEDSRPVNGILSHVVI